MSMLGPQLVVVLSILGVCGLVLLMARREGRMAEREHDAMEAIKDDLDARRIHEATDRMSDAAVHDELLRKWSRKRPVQPDQPNPDRPGE